MSIGTAALAGLALLCWPGTGGRPRWGLGIVRVRTDPTGTWWRVLFAVGRRPAMMRALVATAVALTAAAVLGPLPGAESGLLTGVGLTALARTGSARADRREAAALADAVDSMVAVLRTGQPASRALGAAAQQVPGRIGQVLRDAAAVSLLGGDVPGTLRGGAATGAALGESAEHGIRSLAAGWAISATAGIPLAEVLSRVGARLLAERTGDEEVRAELTGSRTTAVLVAALPALGLLLGTGMGADPVSVLLHQPAGQGALVIGCALDAIGLWWTARLIRSARSP